MILGQAERASQLKSRFLATISHELRTPLSSLLLQIEELRLDVADQVALDLLDTIDQTPCVILLDLMMPVMDGWTFKKCLSARPRDAVIPVVVLSGVADLKRQARVVEAEHCLRKPVDLDRLYDLLSDYCRCA